jgi:hypothetical protein
MAGGIIGAGVGPADIPGPAGSGVAVRSGAPACVRRIAGSPDGRRAVARPPAGCLGAATGVDGLARPAAAGACQPRTAEGAGPASAGLGHQEDGNAGLDAEMIG